MYAWAWFFLLYIHYLFTSQCFILGSTVQWSQDFSIADKAFIGYMILFLYVLYYFIIWIQSVKSELFVTVDLDLKFNCLISSLWLELWIGGYLYIEGHPSYQCYLVIYFCDIFTFQFCGLFVVLLSSHYTAVLGFSTLSSYF